jgi:unsaturated chondroitin disaccharide hydrolase
MDTSTLTPQELAQALQTAVTNTAACLPDFTHAFKYSHSENNWYAPSENVEWTTGFWTGELWLAWEYTKDERIKEAALLQVQSFLYRIKEKIDVEHHDMGFLYSLSCVAAYKLVGSQAGKEAALLAADNLLARFQEKGQFFQAWGPLGAPNNYRLIIDCLLNLPLLFWASRETGESKYARKAVEHSRTAMSCVLRDDNSTYHTYYFDPKTGEPLRGVTAQGYRDGSAWARGQAWGIYGTALVYRYTKDPQYKELFVRVTDFFLAHLPDDWLPYWDFDFSTGSTESRDSSASAIAVCGMLEMADHLEPAEAAYYRQAAKRLLGVLYRTCAVKDPSLSNGQLLHGTYAKSSPYNTCKDRGVDECSLWGDYFYMEALLRCHTSWNPYW